MKIVRFEDVARTDRAVKCPRGGFTSYRYLLEEDRMGFTICCTVIPRAGAQHWHYAHHLEACYCVDGTGVLVNLTTGARHMITPGTLYALDAHDDHTFEAVTDEVTLISVFNPPLTGQEVHDADGSYWTMAEKTERGFFNG